MAKIAVQQEKGFRRFILALILAAVSILFQRVPSARSQEPAPPAQELEKAFPKKPPYSPYAGRHFPERVYWGDTHLHTSFSMDAGAFGCRLAPRDAYRFAKGHEVTASSGQLVRLARPLDFLVVADHSDGFGFFPLMMSGDPINSGRSSRPTLVRHGPAVDKVLQQRSRSSQHFGKGTISKAIFPVPGTTSYQNAWQEIIKAAEEANDPGRFTAFHRLRMDVQYWRQQPAPKHPLPRRWQQGKPG